MQYPPARRYLALTDDDVPTAAPGLLTLEETAAFFEAQYWRHLGVGPDGFRIGRRVLYRREDVDRWVAERQQAQSPHHQALVAGERPWGRRKHRRADLAALPGDE